MRKGQEPSWSSTGVTEEIFIETLELEAVFSKKLINSMGVSKLTNKFSTFSKSGLTSW